MSDVISYKSLRTDIMDLAPEILDAIPVTCYCLDKKGIVSYINRHALTLFNKSTDDCMGKYIFDIVPEFRDMQYHVAAKKAQEPGGVASHDFISTVTCRWIRLMAVPANTGIFVANCL